MQEERSVSLSFNLPPAGSLLLYIPRVIKGTYDIPEVALKFNPVSGSGMISVNRDNENAVAIEFCDLLVGGELTRDLHNYSAADKVYK